MDIHISFLHNHFQVLGNFLIHGGQNTVQGLNNSHTMAQGTVYRRKFHTDYSAAYNNQMFKHILFVQQTVTGDHSRQG